MARAASRADFYARSHRRFRLFARTCEHVETHARVCVPMPALMPAHAHAHASAPKHEGAGGTRACTRKMITQSGGRRRFATAARWAEKRPTKAELRRLCVQVDQRDPARVCEASRRRRSSPPQPSHMKQARLSHPFLSFARAGAFSCRSLTRPVYSRALALSSYLAVAPSTVRIFSGGAQFCFVSRIRLQARRNASASSGHGCDLHRHEWPWQQHALGARGCS
eukprot:3683951-Pleurochrysis_carterae.AAC.1